MKRSIILSMFCLLLCSFVCAQADSTLKGYKGNAKTADMTSFWDKCYVGGDIMLYGNNTTFYFNISPLLGYRIGNKKFSVGGGLTYQYLSYYNVRMSVYGGRVFARQELGRFLFAHAEAETFFAPVMNPFTRKTDFTSIPCASLFLGYKQHFSEFSYYYIMLGYEMIGDRNFQYAYPAQLHPFIFKVGYIFDLKGK